MVRRKSSTILETLRGSKCDFLLTHVYIIGTPHAIVEKNAIWKDMPLSSL